MDDKNKYNNALKKLQEALAPKNGCEISGLTRGYIEEIFPELKESDDERIRKELIRYFKGMNFVTQEGAEKVTRWIAWLEKQETSYTKKDINDAYLKGITDAKNEIEKQHEANYQIRKDIATFIFNYRGDIKDRAKWMNYLDVKVSFVEKQESVNKNKVVKGSIPDVATSLINYINANTKGMCLSNMECDDIEDAIVNNKWYKVYNYMKKKLEKQGEKPQGKTALEGANEEKVDNANKSVLDFKASDYYVSNVDGKIHNIHYCNVPKFKVGNWYQCIKDFFGKGVTFDKNTAYYCAKEGCLQCEYGCHIAIDKNLYDNFKLWSIEDAKDGDVLASYDIVFIFNKIHNKIHDVWINCHCSTHKDGSFMEEDYDLMTIKYSKEVYPATKEQRDTLLKAMADAGYEWDAEKKELKKIKDEEYNGEDYGIDSLFHAQRILEKTLGKVDGYQTDDGILSHKCAITAIKKIKQNPIWHAEDEKNLNAVLSFIKDEYLRRWLKDTIHKEYDKSTEWNEDDERLRKTSISFLKHYADKGYENAVECIDWLESIRPQKQWKPSEEQMIALRQAISGCSYDIEPLVELETKLKEL